MKMNKDELTIEQFVQCCIGWITHGDPMPGEFPFDKYIKIEDYRRAVEERPEWQEYWRNFGQIKEVTIPQ